MEIEHQNLYGGSGIVRISILDVELAPPFASVLLYTLEPLASIGLHQHQIDSTLLLCVAGQGYIHVDNEAKPVVQNEMVMIPCKAQVSIENLSKTDIFSFWMIRGR